MAAYIIGMQEILSLASQRKRVAAPRAEPDGASVGCWPMSRRFVEKTPGSMHLTIFDVRRRLLEMATRWVAFQAKEKWHATTQGLQRHCFLQGLYIRVAVVSAARSAKHRD